MESINLAQGRKLPVMAVALAMALTVNGALALVLVGTPTSGQRMLNAQYHHHSSTMVAETAADSRKVRERS